MTIRGVGPLRPEKFYVDRSVPFISRPKFPSILTYEKHPPPPAPREAHVFHHCVLTTKRSSYFRESMKSPEIKREEVIATWVANVCSFLLARHLMTNAPYPTSCSSWL